MFGDRINRPLAKIYIAVGQSVKACGGLSYDLEVVKLQLPVKQESPALNVWGVSIPQIRAERITVNTPS